MHIWEVRRLDMSQVMSETRIVWGADISRSGFTWQRRKNAVRRLPLGLGTMMNERYIYLLNEIIHVPSIVEADDNVLLVGEVLWAACFSGQHTTLLGPFNLIESTY